MRAFVGIPVPALDPVAALLRELSSSGADLKVVEPQNLHFTLKFLGEIPDAQAPVILERMRGAGFPTRLPLVLRDVGAFPDWKKLNVLWIGLTDPDGAVARSYALSERLFAEIGFLAETRPFSPHLTIARKRSDRGKDLAKQVLSGHRNEEFGRVEVPGPRLYRSILTPQGPVYEALGGAA